MKLLNNDILFGSILVTFFSTIIIWFAVRGSSPPLPIIVAVVTLLIGIAAFAIRIINKRKAVLTGAPAEDEFTKKAKLYAGNQAFHYSMYLWLLIFLFNSSFSKNETMLGIGILGSALIYGISLWYFRTTGDFNAQPN